MNNNLKCNTTLLVERASAVKSVAGDSVTCKKKAPRLKNTLGCRAVRYPQLERTDEKNTIHSQAYFMKTLIGRIITSVVMSCNTTQIPI